MTVGIFTLQARDDAQRRAEDKERELNQKIASTGTFQSFGRRGVCFIYLFCTQA